MVSEEDRMYDGLSIRRAPLLVGLVIVFSMPLIVSGQRVPAYAEVSSTGHEQAEPATPIVRQQMTPTISAETPSHYPV